MDVAEKGTRKKKKKKKNTTNWSPPSDGTMTCSTVETPSSDLPPASRALLLSQSLRLVLSPSRPPCAYPMPSSVSFHSGGYAWPSPHPRADVEPGHCIAAAARRKRQGTYPELQWARRPRSGQHGSPGGLRCSQSRRSAPSPASSLSCPLRGRPTATTASPSFMSSSLTGAGNGRSPQAASLRADPPETPTL